MRLRRYTCRNVRELLPLHAGGDLEHRHVEAVDDHLHGCLSCFREFRQFATMRGQLGVLADDALPKGILDGFTDEVMARIAVDEDGPAAELPQGRLLRLVRMPASRYAAAAAILLVSVLGLHGLGGAGFDPFGFGQGLDSGPGLVEQGPAGLTMVGSIPVPSGDRSGDVPGEVPSTTSGGTFLGPSGGVPVGMGEPATLDLHYPGDQAIPEDELRWDDTHQPRLRPNVVLRR